MLIIRNLYLRSNKTFSKVHFRQFWNWLDVISNKYDRKSVQELGADRACADWIIRCGGSVRFQNWGSFISKRNQLPTGAVGHFRIEEIRAIQASLTSEGFAYLDGLNDLKRIHLEKCDQIDDSAIARCNRVKHCLESIVLIDLVQITAHGLAYLAGLKNLKQIDLVRLSNVKERDSILKLLKTELPTCQISYKDTELLTIESTDK